MKVQNFQSPEHKTFKSLTLQYPTKHYTNNTDRLHSQWLNPVIITGRTSVISVSHQFDFYDVTYQIQHCHIDISQRHFSNYWTFKMYRDLLGFLMLCSRMQNIYRLEEYCSYFQSFYACLRCETILYSLTFRLL